MPPLNSKRKILHIVEATATGTLAMVALLANSQSYAGSDVYIIYSKRPETPSDLQKHFKQEINLTYIDMSSINGKINSIIKIRAILKEVQPEIIFMHSSFAGFIGRISSLWILPNAHFFYIPHCISFMRRDIGFFKRILFTAFELLGSIKNASYIACSASEQRCIQSAIPFRKCYLVENAIDHNALSTLPHVDNCNRRKIVITVGQIRPQKGPTSFAEIARLVKSNDPSVGFVWVGDGDADLRRELEGSGVTITGWVPKEKVWSYLAGARLYLSTARWEGMPVSLIEAGFAETPVVASACAGNIDIVTHNKTGWLFESPCEAATYILSALKDPDLSTSIAESALESAKNRFSAERYAREINALVNS